MCECPEHFEANKIDHCPIKNRNEILYKLNELLQEQMSHNMHKRHLILMNKYIQASSYGYYLVDFHLLIPIIEIIVKQHHNLSCYKGSLKKMLELCSLPPIICNTDQELTQLDYLPKYLSMIGSIGVWNLTDGLRLTIFKSILTLIKCYKVPINHSVHSKFFYSAVEQSGLSESVTQYLNLVDNEEYLLALELSLVLSKISKKICINMAKCGALEYLLMKLITSFETDQQYMKLINVLDKTRMVLWNILNAMRELNADDLKCIKAPNQKSFLKIHKIFRIEVLKRGREFQRNDLTALVLLFLDLFPLVAFIDSKLADDVIMLSVATELGITDVWATDLKLRFNEYDFIFKKMLLMCLCYFDKYQGMDKLMEEHNLIHGLTKILIFNESFWTHEQQKILTVYVLRIFYILGGYFMDTFIDNNGPISLLMLIENYFIEPYDSDILKCCLQTLEKLVGLENEKFISCIQDNLGLSIIMHLCDFLKTHLTMKNQELLSYCFIIVDTVYRDPFHGTIILNYLLSFLEDIIKLKHDNIDPHTVICVVYLLWNIFLKKLMDFERFLKQNGIYILLDLIDVSIFPIKMLTLGFLADLCENELSISFVLSWRGGQDKQTSVYSLLAGIYRKENRMLRTKCTDMDIITDTEFPIMGRKQYEEMFSSSKDFKSSPAIMDLFGSSRPKINAIVQLLNIRHSKLVEDLRSKFKIAPHKLDTLDQITMVSIENFFILKLCEAWREVDVDLKAINLELTDIDRQILAALLKKSASWVRCVQARQEQILRDGRGQELLEERQFYALLKECRKQDALFSLHELKCMARSADRMFMLQHKEKHRAQIRSSLKFHGSCIQHLTYMDNIDVTPVFNLKYNVQYNQYRQ